MINYLKVLLFALFIVSCSTELQQHTKELSRYLNSQFNTEIPESDHIYILQSKFSCQGCIQKVYLKIEEEIADDTKQLPFISILTYDSSFLPETLLNECNVLFDKNADYEYLGIETANITIIKTSKRKITNTMVLSLDKIDVVSDFIN